MPRITCATQDDLECLDKLDEEELIESAETNSSDNLSEPPQKEKIPRRLRPYAPAATTIEIRDIFRRFAKRSKDHMIFMSILNADPDVLTRDTGRINKTKFSSAAKMKSRRIEELINELRSAFVAQ